MLNGLMDGMPCPAVVLNEYRQIIGANQTLLEQLGAASLEDVLGERPGEALEVLEKPADVAELATMLKRFCAPWSEQAA